MALVLSACAWTDRDESQPDSTRLYLAGDGELTVVDPEAGRAEVHELPFLAPGDPRYRIAHRGDALVLWGPEGDTYALDLDLLSPPRKLADSFWFVPSTEPARVWIAVPHRDADAGSATPSLREIAVDGGVTFHDVRAPSQWGPAAAVGDELVFESARGGLELWNPRSGRVTRRLPGAWLGPTHEALLVWCEREGRTLHVLDVESGRDDVSHPPRGSTAFDCSGGAFSPDGTRLAILARAGGYESDRHLTLVDLTRRTARVVAGSAVGHPYNYVGWSSSGDRVFVAGIRGDAQRLLQYRLGAARAVAVPVELRPFYGLAVG